MEGLRSLIMVLCGLLGCVYILGVICSIAKAIVNRDKKNEFIFNILDAIRCFVGYFLINSITLVVETGVDIFSPIIVIYTIIALASIVYAEYNKRKNTSNAQ